MATSGSYLTSKVVNSMTGDGCPDRANISWSASWNPATLQWTVAWSANGAGYYNNNYVTIFSGTVTVKDQNGNVIQTKSMAGQIAQARKDVQLIADSFTLGVDTYGNQSLQFSAVFRIGYNSATGESTGSQTFALDQVPLASYFTYAPSGVTVGSSGGVSTVNITRYNSGYTHDVTWTFGSYSHTEYGVGTSASWTIPATWLNAIPNSATGTCTVTLVTKSGSTPVGQAATAQFTITANVVPSYTNIVYSYRGPAYTAGITNALIAGYSQMRVAVSGAAGAYGSSVARMEFIKGTSTMATVNTSADSYTYDTPLLTAAETTTFTVRITDTRGKYVQQTSQSFTIKAYSMPSFTAASAYRCNSSGTAQNDGTYVKVQATAVATPAENSIVSLTFAEKATTSSTWSAEISIADYPITSGYANTSSYDVRIKATDKLGQTAYKYFTIPTAEYTMDFRVGGKGVAFGKVAETDNLVDSAWDIKTAGTIKTSADAHIGASGSPTVMLECPLGTRWGDVAVRTNARNGVQLPVDMALRLWSYNSSTGARTGYYDQYVLPSVTPDKSSNSGYGILTTKGYVAPALYTITTGYFTVSCPFVTTTSGIFAQPMYAGAIGAVRWIFTTSVWQNGQFVVYVRDANGNLPPDNTQVYMAFLVINA